MIPSKPRKALLALCCAVVPFVPAAHAADGQSIMQKGGTNPGALPCMTCHGTDGKGLAAGGFPRLAGLPADYIMKQLRDFKAGLRNNPIMQPVAQSLTPEEVEAVAAAYAALPKVNVKPGPIERPEPGSGAWIALRGAWERNIPECTLCHGPSGVGMPPTFPPLAGQSAEYIEAQLHAWRGRKAVAATRKQKAVAAVAPTRHNDPLGLMQHIAADLGEDEIKAVAEYFAGLGESKEAFDESQHRLR